MTLQPSIQTPLPTSTQEFPMVNTKHTYYWERTVEGAIQTGSFTSTLPPFKAVDHLVRTWGTCKWTGKMLPSFSITDIKESK